MGFLTERLPADAVAATGGGNSLTPEMVHGLPEAIQTQIVESYNEALMPLFAFMFPLALAAAVLCLFIKEKPLATSLEPEVMPEALAEGNVLITANDDGEAVRQAEPSRR